MQLLRRFPLSARSRPEVHGLGVDLGIVVQDSTSAAHVHTTTSSHAAETRLLLDRLRALGAISPSFCFTSLQILHNCQVTWYVDPNPTESVILAVGDFEGGEVEVSVNSNINSLDLRHNPTIVDGGLRLRVAPFSGDRWSITLFAHHHACDLPRADREFLIGLGFQLPVDACSAKQPAVGQLLVEKCFHIEFGSSFNVFRRACLPYFEIAAHVVAVASDASLSISKRCFPDATCLDARVDGEEAIARLLTPFRHCDPGRRARHQVLLTWASSECDDHCAMKTLFCKTCDVLEGLYASPIIIVTGRAALDDLHHLMSTPRFLASLCNLSLLRGGLPCWINGPKLNHGSWTLSDWVKWPEGTTYTHECDVGALVTAPPSSFDGPGWNAILDRNWSLAPYSRLQPHLPLSAGSLLNAEVAQCRMTFSLRVLRSCELERINGVPAEWSNYMPKNAGESLSARETRRRRLLTSSLPKGLACFLISAVLGQPIKAKAEMWRPPCEIKEACECAALACPYRLDLESRGCAASGTLPPDQAELYAQSSAFIVEQMQTRKTAGKHSPLVCVPSGLNPVDHFNAGLSCESPLDKSARVSDDLDFAVRKVCELGDKIDEWRESRFKLLSECVSKTSTHNAQMNSERSISSSRCSKHVNICANILGAFSIGWPDDLTEALVDGVCPMGPQPMFGIYRRKSVPSSLNFKHILNSAPLVLQRVLNRTPPSNSRHVDAIWEKSLEEQEKGWLSPWMEVSELDEMFGAGGWLPIVRFALWQKERWRMIDDASEIHNLTFEASEHIHTTSPAAAAALTRRFRAVGGHLQRGRRLRGGVVI